MAPARGRTPRKERGPGDFSAIGTKGRRTGAELPDTGIRDEHGLEPIPNFSSPAKALFQPNGLAPDQTYSADDSMDIDQSTIPEPTDLVSATRNGRISLPPRAISPRKTHLNSSPRRSMPRSVGPMSSPSRNVNNGTPTRTLSPPSLNKPVNRQLDFSMERPRQSIEFSPKKAPSSLSRVSRLASTTGKGKNKRAFDLSIGAEDYGEDDIHAMNGRSTTNGIIYDDDDVTMHQPMEESAVDLEAPGDDNGESQLQSYEAEASGMTKPQTSAGAKEKKRRGRKPAHTTPVDDKQLSLSAPDSVRPRGRPPKKAKTESYQDLDADQATTPSVKDDRKQMPPPKPRDAHNKMKASKKAAEKPPSSRAGSRAGSVGPRSAFFQRSETPATDSGAIITRSGRQSIKPLQTWLGEKVVMSEYTHDSLPAIKEVVRMQEISEPPRVRRQPKLYRKSKRQARSQLEDVEEEEDEEERAAWELSPGIMMANVMDWDPNTNKYDEENTREEDIAYSFEAIDMRDIAGADFKFAKTLTLDFFGAGMVDLPPGCVKRMKNSRRMQMVFFVFYGRVTVNVGTPPTKFSIGKGGQWQVPRGNFYSITNESDINSARMFFAQGCEVPSGAMDESAIS